MKEIERNDGVHSSTAKISFWEKMGFVKPKCPLCKSKMKRIEWPYTPGFQCSDPECEHIVWWKI